MASPEPPASPSAADKEAEGNKNRQLTLVCVHQLSNISLSLLTFNARTQLLKELVNGDAALMSSYLTTWTACVGLGACAAIRSRELVGTAAGAPAHGC